MPAILSQIILSLFKENRELKEKIKELEKKLSENTIYTSTS